VTWGLQTFDEMFMGFIDLAELPAVPGDDAKSSNTAAKAVKAEPQ
jgi:hypothetical protein